ncbi:hypothetical protein DQX05_02445 [Paenibacillus thiaminolyticus]|uniref:Uncharacterized protein n=1 Tax=Paenibacillus thiaminolyticus TaxID=49283 RepID=A0A3A3GNN9_PANTH|nr:hypothetical protein DQX05_02445 [Paenibacillus thiaminolyticus]
MEFLRLRAGGPGLGIVQRAREFVPCGRHAFLDRGRSISELPRMPRDDGLHQLDSELPLADGQEWMWGSGGIGYLFWCDRCKVSGHLWQCT